MRLPEAVRWPRLVAGGFVSGAWIMFRVAGHEGWGALDGAIAVRAGTRPQMVNLGETGLPMAAVLGVYAAGLLVRIFLIAYWAAYLVRRAGERNELRKLRRQLEVRLRPEAAEAPPLPHTIRWN